MNKIIWILSTFLLISNVTSKAKDNPLIIYYKITNPTQTPVRVFPDGGLLEGMINNWLLSVKFQGEDLWRAGGGCTLRYKNDESLYLLKQTKPGTSFVLMNEMEFKKALMNVPDFSYRDFTRLRTCDVETVHTPYFPSLLGGSQNRYLLKQRVPETSFVLLNPGETVTASMDLADYFNMTRVGTYHVEMAPFRQF